VAQLGSGNGSGYPSEIDTRQTWVNVTGAAPDSASRVDAELVNDFAAAIVQIQEELGADVAGNYSTLRARLEALTQPAISGGMAEATVNTVNNATNLVASALIPQGARVKAVVIKILTSFSTEHGLSGMHIGGMQLVDGWGNAIVLTAGMETTGRHFRRGDMPLATVDENVVFTAVGGEFGLTGSLFVRVLYETYSAS
jgi:hypothetical protein